MFHKSKMGEVEKGKMQWVCVQVDEEMKIVKNGGGGVGHDVHKGEEGAVGVSEIGQVRLLY